MHVEQTTEVSSDRAFASLTGRALGTVGSASATCANASATIDKIIIA